MLESSSFNKLLTGARECNRILELAINQKSRAGHAQRAVSVNMALADRVKLACHQRSSGTLTVCRFACVAQPHPALAAMQGCLQPKRGKRPRGSVGGAL